MGEIHKVGVVGLGAMGAGIAQVCVEAGVDNGRPRDQHASWREGTRRASATSSRARSRRASSSGRARRGASGGSRWRASSRGFADCDLVIEAIVEELEPKRELFAALDRSARPDAVLATNTSALSVTEIAAATTGPSASSGCTSSTPRR